MLRDARMAGLVNLRRSIRATGERQHWAGFDGFPLRSEWLLSQHRQNCPTTVWVWNGVCGGGKQDKFTPQNNRWLTQAAGFELVNS